MNMFNLEASAEVAEGVYILQVRSAQGVFEQKLVKM
jgi:hypothetical protein